MSQIPIPDDWDGVTFVNHVICWPDSVLWKGILAGLVTYPTRGRFWDGATGSIVAAQAAGRQIIQQNTDSQGEIMGCSDIVTALQAIQQAVIGIENAQVNIEVSSNSQATAAAQANAILVDLSKQIAISQAWANSIAQSTVGITIENNVNITIGSVSPTKPPQAAQQTETGITTTPVPSNEICDKAVYMVDAGIAYFKAMQDLSFGIGEFTVNSIYGLLGDIFAAIPVYTAATLPQPLVSAGILAALAGEIYAQFLIGVFEASRDNGYTYLTDRRESLICLLYDAANSGDETSVIRQAIESDVTASAGYSQQVANLVLGFFNPPLLALLYYVSNQVVIPATTEDCDGLCGV